MKTEEKTSKKVLIGSLVLSIVIIIAIIISIYVFFNSPKKVKKETLDGGSISLTYSDDECGLAISNVTALSDVAGKKLDAANLYFDFSVAVKLEEAKQIDYEISIVPDNLSTIDNKIVKVYLEKQKSGTFKQVLKPTFIELAKEKSDLGSPKGSMVLYKETSSKSTNNNYRLRMWVSDSNQTPLTSLDNFKVKILVKGKAS